jgi:hypothetical protein
VLLGNPSNVVFSEYINVAFKPEIGLVNTLLLKIATTPAAIIAAIAIMPQTIDYK